MHSQQRPTLLVPQRPTSFFNQIRACSEVEQLNVQRKAGKSGISTCFSSAVRGHFQCVFYNFPSVYCRVFKFFHFSCFSQKNRTEFSKNYPKATKSLANNGRNREGEPLQGSAEILPARKMGPDVKIRPHTEGQRPQELEVDAFQVQYPRNDPSR